MSEQAIDRRRGATIEAKKRVLFVTCGLSGIGAAVVDGAAEAGWTPVVLDRAARGDSAMSAGTLVFPEPVDVSDEAVVARACDAIEARHGPIAGLVNAAGILGRMHPPPRLRMADWDREIAVDLRGTFVPCREVGGRMARRGQGAIVNVASVVGLTSAPLHGYAPAKAAVIHLTATLAAEWGLAGVRVNCVSPGFTETPALHKGLVTGVLDRDTLSRAAALGRLVRPQEVAAAILWLLGEASSAVTGVNLPVDAGFLVGLPWAAYGGLRRTPEES